MRRAAVLKTVLLGAIVAAVAGGCLPNPATTQAQGVHELYLVFLAIAAVVAAIVWGMATLAILRFRRRPGDETRLPVQRRGSLPLELTWTALPLITVLILFGLTVAVMNTVLAQSPDPAVRLHVTAFRWGWTFEYQGSGVSITGQPDAHATIELPVGQTVAVTLVSRDVVHAFYVPSFLFKRDATPGLTNRFDLDIDRAGTYTGQCAEFCGVYHDQMLFTIRAVSPADFQAWLAAQPTTAP
jgi:cytochrome c oxidase subunit 2